MSLPVLFGCRSPAIQSYKVKLALGLLELPHEYREVDVVGTPREQRPADVRKVSPGRVR